MSKFPVLNAPPGCVKFVDSDRLDERHARSIHGQTLARLAERGGLNPLEIYGNVHHLTYSEICKCDKVVAIAFTNTIAYKGDL